ncbi:site-specific DNA-methyltransferase [Bradyrhizobium sp. 137]|uniref:DNA methyltransferase n=1 Tax=Bradyrhizobium sp. 137 TaxID=2782614 RepID=UPI001FF87407|nr:DNA methyltransferase [Bradyrhizobium sp. 137]MCK1754138.1 site-specific DNA-methyltransferase [Bradyrhizobium sp. 137]
MLTRTKKIDLRARLRRLEDVDWDFSTSRSQSAFSSLHWHPCRYPSQIPAVLIGALSDPGEVVLDPFLGSGTTAVEAQRLDRLCVGIELNPVSALMARAKTLSRDSGQIRKLVDRIRVLVRQTARRETVPKTVQSEKWYTPRTLNDLRKLRGGIAELRGDGRILAEAAFSAILLPVCRETRHWGYVCDNTAPKDNNERDVIELYEKTLIGFAEAYEARDAYRTVSYRRELPVPEVRVLEGDAADVLKSKSVEGAQLIVTSPPYFGVADYVKAQRLTLEWQGLEIEPLRQKEIGARSKRHRLVAADQYLADCKRVFDGCRGVLDRGRACAVVFGESGDRAPMKEKFEQVVESCQFKLIYKQSRKISSGRRQNPSLQTEHLLIFM